MSRIFDDDSERASFERLKNAIFKDAELSNVDGVLGKLILLNEHYKNYLSEDDVNEIQQKVTKMIRQDAPILDSLELCWFFALVILVAFIFGELYDQSTEKFIIIFLSCSRFSDIFTKYYFFFFILRFSIFWIQIVPIVDGTGTST